MHDVLGAFYAGRAGEADVRALFTDDVAWHVPGANAIAGEYRGVAEVLGYLGRRRDHADGTFRMHPRDTLTGAGDHVAVLTDGTARTGGVERRWSTLGLYRVAGDRVAECWLLPLDPRAVDEAWSR